MGRVLTHQNVWAITGRLEIKFAKLVPLNRELTVIGELTRNRSRAYEARGEIWLPDGTVLVEGSGIYVRIPDKVVQETRAALGLGEVVPD